MSTQTKPSPKPAIKPKEGSTKTNPLALPGKVLVIDIGGTNVKILASGETEPRKFRSGPTMTPQQLVRQIRHLVRDWTYDAIVLGYPGAVIDGRPAAEPKNLGGGWTTFDFQKAFGCAVKIINDAAMQAIGSYEGGRMLFLGLGTGLGSALITDGVLVPMELAHLQYKKGRTYEDYVGKRGLKRLGKKKWRRAVQDVMASLKQAFLADYVVVGGGNAKHLTKPPDWVRLGNNHHAFVGGFRLWASLWDQRPMCLICSSPDQAQAKAGSHPLG
ncbi:MAG: ROK family protein [Nitrospira sp.]|nr:ROK family protein [Nitrospira sp.]MCP9456054.1 ROK family protein [Nitrospira sp.]